MLTETITAILIVNTAKYVVANIKYTASVGTLTLLIFIPEYYYYLIGVIRRSCIKFGCYKNLQLILWMISIIVKIICICTYCMIMDEIKGNVTTDAKIYQT